MRNRTLPALLSLLLLVPAGAGLAQDKRQKDKNLMRNLGIGLGAIAVDRAVKGQHKDALILGAGAAYAGKKYEDARKAQRKESATWRSYRTRNGRRIGYWVMRGDNKVRYVSLR